MALQLLVPALEEPVSLEEAKLHVRVDIADDDPLIVSLIASARQTAETLTGRQFVTARWLWIDDGFPQGAIALPKCPVQAVVALEYLDMSAVWQTMPANTYTVDTVSEPARITPKFGQIWPIALPQIGAVRVTFDAGYGAAAAVPDGIKSWIKLRVDSLYNHRGESAVVNGKLEALPHLAGLLDPYRVALA